MKSQRAIGTAAGDTSYPAAEPGPVDRNTRGPLQPQSVSPPWVACLYARLGACYAHANGLDSHSTRKIAQPMAAVTTRALSAPVCSFPLVSPCPRPASACVLLTADPLPDASACGTSGAGTPARPPAQAASLCDSDARLTHLHRLRRSPPVHKLISLHVLPAVLDPRQPLSSVPFTPSGQTAREHSSSPRTWTYSRTPASAAALSAGNGYTAAGPHCRLARAFFGSREGLPWCPLIERPSTRSAPSA